MNCGNYLYKYIVRFSKFLEKTIKKHALMLLIASGVITFIIATIHFNIYGYQIDLRLNKLGNYFLFYGGAISGIIFILITSVLISKNYVLERVGKYSLILFALHPIAFDFLNQITLLFLNKNYFDSIRHTYLSTIYTALSIAGIMLVALLYKKLKALY